jgi:hypothetical protein
MSCPPGKIPAEQEFFPSRRKSHGQVGWMPRLPTGRQAFLLQGRGVFSLFLWSFESFI